MNPEPRRSAAFYRVAVIIGVVGVLLRLAYCFESGDDPSLHHPIIDSFTYHSYARTIAEGGDPWNGVITRPPLYPYLLGAVYTVFGVNMTAARVLQAILGGATCILTCLLGRRLFDDPRRMARRSSRCPLWPLDLPRPAPASHHPGRILFHPRPARRNPGSRATRLVQLG